MADEATLLAVEEAWARLAEHAALWRPAFELIPASEALGYVLSEAPVARLDSPPEDKSAMDGFAICAQDVMTQKSLPISQRVPAGSVPTTLKTGTAARIFTGAQLPQGADCVVMQENCEYDDKVVTINTDARQGANVRRKGEDVSASATLFSAGHELRPQDIGLLITAGLDEVAVYSSLQVGVIATGDELVDVSQPLPPGKIYESNSPMIAAALARLNCRVSRYRAADTLEATIEVFNKALSENDVVVTIGGVSVGEEDHVQAALNTLGQTEFWKIKVKPGKPFLFGEGHGKPVLGLPGNPVSAFVTFGLFCKPYLQCLRGGQFHKPVRWPAIADFDTEKSSWRQEYKRGTLVFENGEARVKPMSVQGSAMHQSLCNADVLIEIPADQTISKNQAINVIPMSAFIS